MRYSKSCWASTWPLWSCKIIIIPSLILSAILNAHTAGLKGFERQLEKQQRVIIKITAQASAGLG
jgi:hypothetical protein